MRYVTVLLLLAIAPLLAQPAADQKDWVHLFNGRNLDGWTPKITGYALGDNYGNTFRVEDGLLKVAYDKYDQFGGRFGHIFYKQKYSYYVIAVEYRFTGEQIRGGPDWGYRNSGIMIHCQAPESMGKGQDFPISIEVQLLGGNGKDARPNGSVCTPGTNIVMGDELVTKHCVTSSSPTFHGDQWVRVEAVVHGGSVIRHIVNGQTVMTYEMPQVGGGSVTNFDPVAKPDGKLLTEGYISLQSESHPIEFRKVELLDLTGCADSKAKNYKSYFVKPDNAACRY